MSMEIYVLSPRRLNSIAEWQKAIDIEGFSLVLNTERPFEELQGFLPARWHQGQAGFECDHWSVRDVVEGYPDIKPNRSWKYCIAFRWGADVRACLGAYMAASAYATATDGIVLDCDAGKLLTPEQARQMAAKIEKELPSFERAMQSTLAQTERRFRPST